MFDYIKLLFLPIEANNYRPRILEKRYFVMLVILLVGVKILSVASFERYLGADIFNSISQTDLYSLTNQARTSNQLPSLNPNSKLELAAQMKLNDMLQNSYFAHISPTGVTPWTWFGKANYDYLVAGENLAMNFYNSDQTMKAWMNSDLHRKNILLPDFQETGIAVDSGVINGQTTTVVVQVFGKPKVPELPPTQVARVDTKIVPKTTPKPVVTAKSAVVKSTPKLKPKQTQVATASTPKPSVQFVPTTFTHSVKPSSTPQALAQVKSEISFADSNRSGLGAYAYNIFLENLMVILFAIMLGILILKLFVKINIQTPELILRAVILILLSITLINIKDTQIMSYIYGNIILP